MALNGPAKPGLPGWDFRRMFERKRSEMCADGLVVMILAFEAHIHGSNSAQSFEKWR